MVDAADAAGRLLTIGFNLRYTRSAGVLKRFVDSGRFGNAVYTRAWTKSSQIPWWGQHYRREISGGGALASTAVHLLDLALWLAGNPARPRRPRRRAACSPPNGVPRAGLGSGRGLRRRGSDQRARSVRQRLLDVDRRELGGQPAVDRRRSVVGLQPRCHRRARPDAVRSAVDQRRGTRRGDRVGADGRRRSGSQLSGFDGGTGRRCRRRHPHLPTSVGGCRARPSSCKRSSTACTARRSTAGRSTSRCRAPQTLD